MAQIRPVTILNWFNHSWLVGAVESLAEDCLSFYVDEDKLMIFGEVNLFRLGGDVESDYEVVAYNQLTRFTPVKINMG